MEKPEGSYLLFDTDVTPYQERNDEDPSVQKFASKQSVEDTGEKPKKKKMSLDRSLKGMIEQERDDLTERNYFS